MVTMSYTIFNSRTLLLFKIAIENTQHLNFIEICLFCFNFKIDVFTKQGVFYENNQFYKKYLTV